MEIKVSISLPTQPPASSTAKPQPTLKQRVQYAIDCIECLAPNKHAAIEFLQQVYAKLDMLKQPTEEQTLIKEMINPVVHEYGYYPVNSVED